ncbi:MAG TPA: pyridoxal phosphate-dependent aminotransferase [Candidatus Bathyarchaeia archaeon]|nr:pyridoxal phosphate-dependent aminotransferase [Candidatus Bathyarchaeia archaeon]
MSDAKAIRAPRVNPLVQNLKQNPIREMTKRIEQARGDPEIISFGGGQPSLPPPDFVLKKAPEYLKEIKAHRYTSTQGLVEVRDALAKMMVREEGWSDIGAENILLTQSGSNGIEAAVSALAHEGDEAIVITPTYTGYIGTLETHGVRIIPVRRLPGEGYKIDFDLLSEQVRRGKSRFIIVCSPDNPTGRIFSSGEIKTIGDLAEDYGLAIISDESYYRITYEEDFRSFRDYLPNLIGVRSFSKTASATGWRIGYNYADSPLLDAMEKVNQFRMLCVSPFFQELVYEFVEEHEKREEYLRHIVTVYKDRRDAMSASLERRLPEAKFQIPQGAFYFFIQLPGIRDDTSFSHDLFSSCKVAMVPGSAFGMNPDEGFFRLTFVSEDTSRIDEGIERIAGFVRDNVETPRLTGPDY